MLLSLLIDSAIAGGPPQWDPATQPIETVVQPLTVNVEASVGGYTRVEITNNMTKDLSLDLWTGYPEDFGFRVLKMQADVMCPPSADAPRGDDIPDYMRCMFTLPAGTQTDVIVTYAPKGPATEPTMGELTIVAYPVVGKDEVTEWAYLVEKALIGMNTSAE